MIKGLFLLLFIGCLWVGNAQTISLYPNNFSLYQKTKTWINPSAITQDSSSTELSVANKTKRNTLGNVAMFQFEAGIVTKHTNMRRQLKLLVVNEKEGPYISSPSAYINYALQLPIGVETTLSLGTNAGFASSFVNGSTLATNATFITPDASLGVTLNHKKLELGISAMQIFNNTVNDYKFAPQLCRYYHFQSSYLQTISPKYSLRFSALYSHYKDIDDPINIGLSLENKKRYSTGITYQNIKGVMCWINYTTKINKKYMDISFAYNTGFYSSSPKTNQDLELLLSLSFD